MKQALGFNFSREINRKLGGPWVLTLMDALCNTLQSSARLLYDRKEAARQLSISVRSLDYLIANGKIDIRRIGSRILISHEELVRFAAAADLRSVA